MLAYGVGDAFTEVPLPCPWYVLPLAQRLHDEADWKPISRDEYMAKHKRSGTILKRDTGYGKVMAGHRYAQGCLYAGLP